MQVVPLSHDATSKCYCRLRASPQEPPPHSPIPRDKSLSTSVITALDSLLRYHPSTYIHGQTSYSFLWATKLLAAPLVVYLTSSCAILGVLVAFLQSRSFQSICGLLELLEAGPFRAETASATSFTMETANTLPIDYNITVPTFVGSVLSFLATSSALALHVAFPPKRHFRHALIINLMIAGKSQPPRHQTAIFTNHYLSFRLHKQFEQYYIGRTNTGSRSHGHPSDTSNLGLSHQCLGRPIQRANCRLYYFGHFSYCSVYRIQ